MKTAPAEIKAAAQSAIAAGANQYAPGKGVPALREAIASHQQRFYGLNPDPDTEVLVTTGATEAIAATLLAFIQPGDEVLTFEPFYDSYGPSSAWPAPNTSPLPCWPRISFPTSRCWKAPSAPAPELSS